MSLKLPAAEGPVFRLRWSGVRHAFRRAVARAGLQGVSFHTLRHSFASRSIAAGVPLAYVEDLMRHSDVRLTMRYTHPQLDHLRAAVELLNPTPKMPAVSVTA